jgi:hypothetical protein
MYRNKFPIAEYAMRGTAAGGPGKATSGAIVSLGEHKEAYLVAYVASSHPHYNSRQPKLGLSVDVSGDEPDKLIMGNNGRWALSVPIKATTLALTQLSGYSNNYFTYNLSPFAFGNVKINHWLTQNVANSSARATYSLWVITKGAD